MSIDESFIKMFNNLAKEFKSNVKEIDDAAQDVEKAMKDSLEFLLKESNRTEMKAVLDSFFDNLDLDELFSKVDLKNEIDEVVIKLKNELGKFNLDLDDFPPKPYKILSALPDLIPANLQAKIPNLKSQLQELVNVISNQDIRIKFKKVTEAVPPKTSKTSNANSLSNGLSGFNKTQSSPTESFEKFISDTFAGKEILFDGVIEKIENKLLESGLFQELDEKIKPLFKIISSDDFSASSFAAEASNLIKDLATISKGLIKDVIDILFDNMAEILGFVNNALNKPPNNLVNELLHTLIPEKSLPNERSISVLTLPALVLSTPFSLISKHLNKPAISQEIGNLFASSEYGSSENIFNSSTGYGSAQLFKGGLVFLDLMGSTFKFVKGKKLSDREKEVLEGLSFVYSVIDVLANFAGQFVSSGSAISSLDKANSEGEHERANFAIWVYQWFSAIIWPIIVIFWTQKVKGDEDKEDKVERIVAILTLFIELIHLGMFVYINITAKSLDQRVKVANVIDPMPGIYGATSSFISVELKSNILTLEQVLNRVDPDIVKIKAILDATINSPGTQKLQDTYTTLEIGKPEIIGYLNTTLGPAIVSLRNLFNNHAIFTDPNLTNILPNLKRQVVSSMMDEILTETNTNITTEYLINNRRQIWEPRLMALLEEIGNLKLNLEAKSSQRVQASIESLDELLSSFKQEKELIAPISSKLDKSILKLRRNLNNIQTFIINNLNIVIPTQESTAHWENFKVQFLNAKTSLHDAWPINPNVERERVNKLERELNILNDILLTIINNSKSLRGQHESTKASVEKKQLYIEIMNNLFTLGFQIAYGSLILSELPSAIYQFSQPKDGKSYKNGEEIIITLLVSPVGINPKLKISTPDQTVIELESEDWEFGNWPHERQYKYTINTDENGLASIILENNGTVDTDKRVCISFLVNNPQDLVLLHDISEDDSANEVSIQTLNDPNDSEIEIWLAPSGTTKFEKDVDNMSTVNGNASTLRSIHVPKEKGGYHLFVKDANGFVSPESKKIVQVK